jgi:hypothetical protein
VRPEEVRDVSIRERLVRLIDLGTGRALENLRRDRRTRDDAHAEIDALEALLAARVQAVEDATAA